MSTKVGTFRALAQAMASWRTASVALLSFASGLPLGLLWIAIPDWMRKSGIDIRVVGLITLVQAPYTFKMLWSPLMDRYAPPWLGRRRGWIAICQIALFVLMLGMAGLGDHPEAVWVVAALCLAIAFASASQDIVIDAYSVDVLRPEEHGVAVGSRTALYRAAMFIAGGLSISLAARISWPLVNVLLASLYLPLMLVTWKAPEPQQRIVAPKTLREAVWEPFLGFLTRHRALEILAFVFFYKLADNLAQSLQRPFLYDMGYSDDDRGVGLATVGTAGTVVGTVLGGALTSVIGLGNALWVFGFLQVFSNVGFILVSQSEVNRPLMYGAMAFEQLTTGLGMGAFGVLLLRMTQRRFSATQYALFSSLFGLPRLIAGPITGAVVNALGWTGFFWLTLLAGIPGLVLLARFVPPGRREPTFSVEPPRYREPLSTPGLVLRGVAGGVVGCAAAFFSIAVLTALESMKGGKGFDLIASLLPLLAPTGLSGWLAILGAIVFGATCGLMTAAVSAALHGAGIAAAVEPSAPGE